MGCCLEWDKPSPVWFPIILAKNLLLVQACNAHSIICVPLYDTLGIWLSLSLLCFRKVIDLCTKNPILLQPHQLYSSSFSAGLPLPAAKEQPQNRLFYSFSWIKLSGIGDHCLNWMLLLFMYWRCWSSGVYCESCWGFHSFCTRHQAPSGINSLLPFGFLFAHLSFCLSSL
jgi:hypothetical protein